jgi:hypothetical protein
LAYGTGLFEMPRRGGSQGRKIKAGGPEEPLALVICRVPWWCP